MKYLCDYKNFVSTIKDPLERLDDIEVYLEDFERGVSIKYMEIMKWVS